MTRAPQGLETPERLGLLPTNSPSLMTTIRRAAACWTGSFRRPDFLQAGAARPMTMNRLPILRWLMAVPVRAKADEALAVYR
jgi:hypothetical protein